MACGYCGKDGLCKVSVGCGGSTAEFCTAEHFGLFVRRIKRTVRGLPTREKKPTRRRRNAKAPST